jgi:hypothetical protein
MKFVAQVKGNIADYMKLEAEGGARAASRVMGEETRRLQLDLRGQVNAAFGAKGRGLGNAWRAQTFPRSRPSLGAAGLVWSKVPAIVDAFEKGAMIRPKGGKKFLAIPTGFNADRGRRGRGSGGMRVTPALMAGGVAEVGTGNRKGREAWARGLLKQGMVPMFILTPAVKLPKRLDIRKPAEQAAARIPGRFVAEWDREVRANVRT